MTDTTDTTDTTSAVEALGTRFSDELGERVLSVDVAYGQLTITVAPDAFPQAARYCKQEVGLTFFDFLSAVDEREEGFSVVARLYSHVTRQAVMLRTMVPGGRDEPRLPTLTDVYAGANWHERETYDMFGIVFEGHPGLLPRILTVENFEGWPLRKEFRLASRDVKPWPGAKEPGEPAAEGGDAAPAASAPTPGEDPGDRAAAAKAKAERAKAKATEARKRKAAEKAAAEGATGEEGAATEEPEPEDRPLADESAAGDVTEPATTEGGDPEKQGPPGVQAEGTHDLDAEDSTAREGGDSDTDDADDTDEGEGEDRE